VDALYEVYRFMLIAGPDFPSSLEFPLPLVAHSSRRLTHGEITSGLRVTYPVRVGVFMYGVIKCSERLLLLAMLGS